MSTEKSITAASIQELEQELAAKKKREYERKMHLQSKSAEVHEKWMADRTRDWK